MNTSAKLELLSSRLNRPEEERGARCSTGTYKAFKAQINWISSVFAETHLGETNLTATCAYAISRAICCVDGKFADEISDDVRRNLRSLQIQFWTGPRAEAFTDFIKAIHESERRSQVACKSIN